MQRERSDHTLQPTALINEAYLRLARETVDWQSRQHFIGVAANVNAEMRAGGLQRVELEDHFLTPRATIDGIAERVRTLELEWPSIVESLYGSPQWTGTPPEIDSLLLFVEQHQQKHRRQVNDRSEEQLTRHAIGSINGQANRIEEKNGTEQHRSNKVSATRVAVQCWNRADRYQ
jgi:hypothetical protein